MPEDKFEFDRALGARIRQAREKAGVKQDQLGRAVDLSRTSITNIEQGRQGVQAYLLARIAHVLGWSVGDLFPSGASARSIPDRVRELAPSKRAGPDKVVAWMERVMKSPALRDDNET